MRNRRFMGRRAGPRRTTSWHLGASASGQAGNPDRETVVAIPLGSAGTTYGCLVILQNSTDDAAAGGEGAPVVRVVGDFSCWSATLDGGPVSGQFFREAVFVAQTDSDDAAVLMPIDLWSSAGLASEHILQMRQRYIPDQAAGGSVSDFSQVWLGLSEWDIGVSRKLTDDDTLCYTAQFKDAALATLTLAGYFRVLRKRPA